MQSKNDRRSQRTRLALGDALVALMMERGYDAISIKDIIDHANVGRSTFYSHFADKDELFASQMKRVVSVLVNTSLRTFPKETLSFPVLDCSSISRNNGNSTIS